ncbi:MAG: hypothetical protein GXO82_09245 [Chlorobi bacterium]|nr:hypothetical protein [Chlorobiota bacterium]
MTGVDEKILSLLQVERISRIQKYAERQLLSSPEAFAVNRPGITTVTEEFGGSDISNATILRCRFFRSITRPAR